MSQINPILLAIPFFFLLIGLEWLVAKIKGKKIYRFNDAITNLNIGVGSQVFSTASKVLILGFYIWIYNHFALIHQPATWWSFLICLFAFDFVFYWAHRWGHEINFFWGAHVVHHQSEEYNLSVALRQPWIHNIIAFVIFIPLPLLGFDPKVFFIAAAVHTLYQFWIHTKVIDKLPKPIEYIFNTPSHHRVHHGVNPKYIDKNHGGVFIFWDRMFGTFQAEEEEPTYGITTQLQSWNPTWANLEYYVGMFNKATQMTKLCDKLRIIVARPGWQPQELGGMQYAPEVDKEHYRPYNTQTSLLKNLYILVQFALISVGLVMYMSHFETISLFYKVVFFLALILSVTICGGIFESKRWVVYAEYARILLIALSLNTFYYYWYIDWFMVMLVSSVIGSVLLTVWFTVSLLLEPKPAMQTIS